MMIISYGMALSSSQIVYILSKLFEKSLEGGFAAAVEDIDDDGRADEGCHAVDGHSAFKAGSAGNQIAYQSQGCATQGGGGHEFPVVAGAEKATGQMRYGHTDEHDRAAIGSDDSN